jgi:uncharacterized membrane protein
VEKLIFLLKSRKFWAAVVGLAVVIASNYGLDLPEEQVLNIVIVLVGYIVGTAIEDGLRSV